jgi:Zn-dependent protease with chaperone function
MRAIEAVSDNAGTAALVLAGGLAVLALLAFASGTGQLWRTARTLRPLHARSTRHLPPRLRQLTVTIGVHHRVRLIDDDALFAFCHGLIRPQLWISRALCDALRPDELEAVLRHEAAHLRKRDPLRIVVARSLRTALAFVPLTTGILQAYACRREIEADRETTDAMGDVLPLAGALHRMLASARQSDLSPLAVGALTATDVRIDRLLGEQTPASAVSPPANRLHMLLFTPMLVVMVCLLIATAHFASGVRPCVHC